MHDSRHGEGMFDRTAGDAPVSSDEMALGLTLEALRQGHRAIVGLLAVPTSLALGTAAAVSFAASFVERGFESFEQSFDRLAAKGGHILRSPQDGQLVRRGSESDVSAPIRS